jgi:hypothetical protein
MLKFFRIRRLGRHGLWSVCGGVNSEKTGNADHLYQYITNLPYTVEYLEHRIHPSSS